MKNAWVVITLLLVVIAGILIFYKEPAGTISSFDECVKAGNPVMESYPPQCRSVDGDLFVQDIGNELENHDLIRVSNPRPNMTVSSPLEITGEARGSWFFEAVFPVRIEDSNGNVLGSATATAQGDWMTTEFVPFMATVNFTASSTERDINLILEKDNPSGLPENDDQLIIPVRISEEENTVLLFYYNQKEDPNTECAEQAVLPVRRQVPKTITPIQDTIKLLLAGGVTNEEKEEGFTTEFPLEGLSLKGANLKQGMLTLEFGDPQMKTTGGSCRVTLLQSQIAKTAKQFPEVKEVRFIPEEVFQP